MSRYFAPVAAPKSAESLSQLVIEELKDIANALAELETDSVQIGEFNAEPDKVYDGLVVFADGTNWNPGSGQGVYVYYAAAWNFLG